MATFFISIIAFALALSGMAIGVLLGGKPIKGSCGGVNTIKGLENSCGCDNPCEAKKLRIAALAKAQAEG